MEKIGECGFLPEIFHDPFPRPSLAGGQAWSPNAADEVARRCVGAVIIGLPRWVYENSGTEYRHASEYCHYEGALARTLRIPLLLVAEQGLARRGIFDQGVDFIVGFPRDANRAWLKKKEFSVPFARWVHKVQVRRDIFLGYCSSSHATARLIKAFFEQEIGITVLDWATDFAPASSILTQIEEAAEKCTAGVFLFTRDDVLGIKSEQAAPRDNVVFEAGYFAAVKGKQRVLIIREKGSKMPADLGGDIYVPLEDRSNIGSIAEHLRRFVDFSL